ncbi:hypothetical protein GCM10009830_45980 [Glycomyces endophyticus]|uniref:Helix-hairpin-helix domain-containing protein n=1 Tax=Glycomyces endophyticus TaxID=480996 RepID=A0ABP4TWB4_9ACTN
MPSTPRPSPRGPHPATFGWALLPLLVPGAGAPLAFGVAAGRRPAAATVAPLIAHTAAFLGFFALILPFDVGETPDWAMWSAFLVMIAGTVGATVHLLAIRRYVWGAVEARPAPRPGPTGDWVAPALDQAARNREDARRLAEGDPLLAKRTGVGRPDLERRLDDGGLVDLNHAPAEVLRKLPGFNAALAEQVRERVEREGPFQSIDEVILEVGVSPGFERHLREYAVLIP